MSRFRKIHKKNVTALMFDVRPVDRSGLLDWKKIGRKSVLLKSASGLGNQPEAQKRKVRDVINGVLFFPEHSVNYSRQPSASKTPKKNLVFIVDKKTEEAEKIAEPTKSLDARIPAEDYFEFYPEEKPRVIQALRALPLIRLRGIFQSLSSKIRNLFPLRRISAPLKSLVEIPRYGVMGASKNYAISFTSILLIAFLIVPAFAYVNRGRVVKTETEALSLAALDLVAQAGQEIGGKDFDASQASFQEAYAKFSEASVKINELGVAVIEISRFLPFTSKLASGKYALEAGKKISSAGISMSEVLGSLSQIENPLEASGDLSLLELFQKSKVNLEKAGAELVSAADDLEKVSVDDIPEEKRGSFMELKKGLPAVNVALSGILAHSQIFTDILGGNGPRKYLFLFQNNQEMRATGGFIGSYGVLSISGGRVKSFYIDEIFNPDGQLMEKVVPPKPIQKVSVAWSTHDANWFPDFPTSSEKISWFYEKTGGPTVDGVIAMTPTIMQKMLEVTGPIAMDEYGTEVNADNFIEATQYEVEVDYDKDLNRPKKFIADLAPKILDELFNEKDLDKMAKALSVVYEGLNQKHILIYSRNFNIQKFVSGQNWGGEIMNTDRDYLSVINSNINGYKTDGVIDEEISHEAQIGENGEIIDTVTVKRTHKGGNEKHDWWNKVNADYMRIYVPLGSELLEVEGQTREINEEPVNYSALNFKYDPQLKMQEDSMAIDEKSGTRIYEENHKTVFANWVYVSPGETAEISYKYKLPYKIVLEEGKNPTGTYSLLVQKQSGSISSKINCSVDYPDRYNLAWNYPDFSKEAGRVYYNSDLAYDRYLGLVFSLITP